MLELNKVYLGDCLEVMKDVPDKSVDMILCDLPYGTTKCKWDTIIPFDKLWEQYKRIIKDYGCIALFGTEPFSSHLRLSNEKWFKYDWIWHKSKCGSAFTSKYRPQQKHEIVSIFGKARINYNPILIEGKPYYRKKKSNKCNSKPNNHNLGVNSDSETINFGFRYPETVIFFQQKWRRQDQLHPTQKPVPLLEYLIKTYSNEGELVLDNCAGSGSTLVAAQNLNRNFIGIEKEPKYYEICLQRLEENKKLL